MKKLLFSLMLIMSLIGGAMAQNDAMYIYRNDGDIDAFLKVDIDSIRHSHFDLDSIYHKENVVQEIWTADSVYRIPLSVIDSVSFVTPKPVYQEGVQVISDDVCDYVLSYSDSTIVFRPQIPTHLLPTVGQIVVSDAYEEPFPTGFSGRMKEEQQYVDSIVCLFDPVCLDDIYSKLLLVGSSMTYEEEERETRHSRQYLGNGENHCISLPASISVGTKFLSAELEKPSLRIDYFVCLGEENLKNVVKLKARFKSSGSVGIKIDTIIGKEPHWDMLIPIKVGVVAGSIEFGWFCQCLGSAQASFPFDISYSGGFTYTDTNGFVSDTPTNEFTWNMPNWNASFNLSLFAGVASRLSIALLHTKVACLDLTGKFGVEVSSTYTITNDEGNNTTIYENLKGVEVQSALKLELQPGYRIWFCDRKDFGGASFSFDFLKKTEPLVPDLSKLYWNRQSSTSGELGGKVEKDIFMPIKLGWNLYQEDEFVLSEYLPGYYWKQNSWANNGLQMQLSNLPQNIDKAYPVVQFMNSIDVLVPECVNLKNIPVKITNFEQTGATYSAGAYVNDGIAYDYKFEVAVTTEIESLEGVEEWGYAYKDPSGNVTRIPLTQFGTSYADTRYAYYRNEATSSVCLFGYVRYEGRNEYYDGEPQYFTLEMTQTNTLCPDDHHPHAIDLGLPSGTKWCCMNVGALCPEDYGGYYAWGETHEKNVYNDVNYEYSTGDDTNNDNWYEENKSCQDIGEDIAQTQYDVAFVKMGNDWHMPNTSQVVELEFHCDYYEYTYQNEIPGFLITGKNGNKIFLPASGIMGNDINEALWQGSIVRIYTSSVDRNNTNNAWTLTFSEFQSQCVSYDRSCGLPVRAVYK